jgi:hypothetical protein
MSPFRYRDEPSSSTGTIVGVLAGAVAGFAVGMLVAQRVGGMSGLRSTISRRVRRGASPVEDMRERYTGGASEEDYDEIEDDFEAADYDESLEERVLEAFRNDPILSERAIDIGSIADGVIELAGWVEEDDEAQHAVTIARGVPGVDTVVNRIAIGDEERRFEAAAQRVRDGSAGTESHWDGGRVGTGRRRQGRSDEPDRHADPKVPLEERWNRADDALRNAADDTEGLAERRARSKRTVRGDRTGGAPIAPTGVPKGDHVADPIAASEMLADENAGTRPDAAQIRSDDRF